MCVSHVGPVYLSFLILQLPNWPPHSFSELGPSILGILAAASLDFSSPFLTRYEKSLSIFFFFRISAFRSLFRFICHSNPYSIFREEIATNGCRKSHSSASKEETSIAICCKISFPLPRLDIRCTSHFLDF